MSLKKFLQKRPLAFKTNPIPHVRSLMNRYSIPEIPVIDEEKLLGTITCKMIVDALKKVETENMLALHLIDKEFIKADMGAKLKDLINDFIKRKRHIACIFDSEGFVGYVRRKKLVELLLGSKERIEGFVVRDFATIDSEESVKKLVKLIESDQPMLVLKDGKPWAAFSSAELHFTFFISDYVTRKLERDFETLRAEGRKLLRSRMDQQLLSYLKEKAVPYTHPLKVEDIADEAILSEKKTVGDAAKLMLDLDRNALAVEEGGMVTDLSLLRALL